MARPVARAKRRTSPNPVSRRGFTFVEVGAIIVVIALCAALVVPNLVASRRGQGERLLLTQLPAFVLRARNEALTRRATLRISFDGQSSAFVLDLDDQSQSQTQGRAPNAASSRSSNETQETGQPIALLSLPEGVSVDRFILNGSDSGEGDWGVRFFGDGTAESSTLEFRAPAESFCLVIDARKGTGEVREGAVADQPEDRWEAGELEKRV